MMVWCESFLAATGGGDASRSTSEAAATKYDQMFIFVCWALTQVEREQKRFYLYEYVRPEGSRRT